MTEITVITATIPGREAMLEEARASVEAQTLPAAKHIVYKDVSRRGIRFAMNALWPQVKTPWMQWLADDDLLLPHHLETLAQYTDEADIIHGYCEVEGRPGFSPNYSAEEGGYWMPATALMRTSFVRDLGGWSMTDWPEDHHFWIKAAKAGARFVVHREPTWVYRFHGSNLTFAPVGEQR